MRDRARERERESWLSEPWQIERQRGKASGMFGLDLNNRPLRLIVIDEFHIFQKSRKFSQMFICLCLLVHMSKLLALLFTNVSHAVSYCILHYIWYVYCITMWDPGHNAVNIGHEMRTTRCPINTAPEHSRCLDNTGHRLGKWNNCLCFTITTFCFAAVRTTTSAIDSSRKKSQDVRYHPPPPTYSETRAGCALEVYLCNRNVSAADKKTWLN